MIPRVKQYQRKEGFYSATPVFPATEDGAAARLILSHFLPAVPTEVGECATVSLSPLAAAGRGEYTLGVFPDGIAIAYGDFEGLRNALATLAALYGEGGYWVRPLSMFLEVITRDGKSFSRFEYIGE